MNAQHDHFETPRAADREALLYGVASLRERVASMAGDIREILRENAALRNEIEHVRRGHRTSEQWMHEAERIKREVAHLADLHDRASGPAHRTTPPVGESAAEDRSRKMMMLMMLANMS